MKIGKTRHVIDGQVVSEAEFNRRSRHRNRRGVPRIAKTYSTAAPLVSEGMGCLPNQVPEMREFVKERGLTGVEVLPSGAVALTSRGDSGRRGLLRARGLVDNDGGYGD